MNFGGALDPGSPGIPTGATGFGAGVGDNFGMGSMGGLAAGIGSLPPSGWMEDSAAEEFKTEKEDLDKRNSPEESTVDALRRVGDDDAGLGSNVNDSGLGAEGSDELKEQIFEPRDQPGDHSPEDYVSNIPHNTLVDPVLNVLGDVHAKGIHVIHAETITYRADDVGGSGPVAGTLQRITRIDDVGKGEPIVRQEIYPETSSPTRIKY